MHHCDINQTSDCVWPGWRWVLTAKNVREIFEAIKKFYVFIILTVISEYAFVRIHRHVNLKWDFLKFKLYLSEVVFLKLLKI